MKGSLPESRPKNIARIRINDDSCWVLLDNGSTINAVTPQFIEAYSLDIGPLSNLNNGRMGINGLEGLFSQPWGYIIIRVQVEGARGYDKIKWPWLYQIQLPLDPKCWLLWVHQPLIESSM